jgi:hypothetical protein
MQGATAVSVDDWIAEAAALGIEALETDRPDVRPYTVPKGSIQGWRTAQP